MINTICTVASYCKLWLTLLWPVTASFYKHYCDQLLQATFLFLYVPANNFSVMSGRVFQYVSNDKSVLLKDTTQCCWWGSNLLPLGLVSSITATYEKHWPVCGRHEDQTLQRPAIQSLHSCLVPQKVLEYHLKTCMTLYILMDSSSRSIQLSLDS